MEQTGIDIDLAIMVALAALVVAVVIVYTAIDLIRESRPVEGTVVSKSFEPGRLENTTSTQIAADGSVLPSVGVRRIPDRWILSVEPTGGGSRVTRTVSRSRWKEIEVGDHWED